jgi:ABC-2 type transport system ATP-binding protein
MSNIVLSVDILKKDYDRFRALNGVTFEVKKGSVVGFLGPNGAGKTTTIQILLGITLPTSGEIRYFGKDFAKHREAILRRINFASAFNTQLGRISVMENLMVFAHLYEVKKPRLKIEGLLDDFDAQDLKDVIYQNLSSGQKTRINIIKSLLNDPEIILMDEPTASLDPDIADKTLSHIEKLKHEHGLTILYTSHNMNEITRICDDVIFLDKGTIIAQDTPKNLTKRIDLVRVQIHFEGKRSLLNEALNAHSHKHTFESDHEVMVETGRVTVPALILAVAAAGVRIVDVSIDKPSLEDVFLQIARGAKS